MGFLKGKKIDYGQLRAKTKDNSAVYIHQAGQARPDTDWATSGGELGPSLTAHAGKSSDAAYVAV